ncbi:MAG TPA: phosphatase PAP2 family protein [Methylomirabilota bacterium]|jgi:undecaprenyl-diphosphatase|nr:phosphatase PAP2 family protein [Methylomirabilota bacterium]
MDDLAARRWLMLSIGGGALFLALAVLVFSVGLLPGDTALYNEILSRITPAVREFFSWANIFGNWKGLVPATVLLFVVSPHARRRWWLIALILIGAPVLEHAAKVLVGRTRPRGRAMGFPSGHATGAAAFAVLAIYFAVKERWGRMQRFAVTIAVLCVMVLVGIARMVLHAHWPSDVLGGFLLGGSCAAAGAWWDASRSQT